MGTIHHHALIVTGWNEGVNEAHAKALELYGEAFADNALYTGKDAQRLVGPIVASLTNGYRTFVLHPDGSKEWWKTSDEIEAARDNFIEWLRTDGQRLYLDWVLVGFGELGPQVTTAHEELAHRE